MATSEHLVNWFTQALCFEDRSKVTIENNWFHDHYNIPFISVVECDSKMRECAS